MASRSATTAPARCSASAPTWKAACGPRASWPSRRARSRPSTALCSNGRRSPSCPACTGGKRPAPMLISFCGGRGPPPAPGADYVRDGGSPSCVAVAHAPGAAPVLALDAGTGLANLTGLLGGAAFAGTVLLSHLHWDHSLGLPFFRAGDRDDARVTLLLPQQEGGPGGAGGAGTAERLLGRGMAPPDFPIT